MSATRAYLAALALVALSLVGVSLAGFSRPQGGETGRGLGRAAGGAAGFSASQGVGETAPVATGTQLIPDATEATTIYYVSYSEGSDSNDGLSEENPKQTVAAGLALLTTSARDQRLLFKRGDVWPSNWGATRASGASAAAPCVYGAYGTGSRPRFDVPASTNAVWCQGGGGTPTVVANVAFQDLDWYVPSRDPNNGAYSANNGGNGLRWLRGFDNVVFERCSFRFTALGVNLSNPDDLAWSNGFTFNECSFENTYNAAGNSQGVYADPEAGDGNATVRFTRCIFYRNGSNPDIPVAETTLNHGLYAQSRDNWAGAVDDPVWVENCLFLYNSSNGIQARSGGTIKDSLFIRNAIAILVGAGTVPVTGGVKGLVSGNVILEGDDIAGSPRAWGIDLDNISATGVTVTGNRLANAINPDSGTFAVDTHANATYSDNKSWNWIPATPNAKEQLSGDEAESFSLSLATFDTAQGGPGTEANAITQILMRHPDYSIEALLAYFRAGLQ